MSGGIITLGAIRAASPCADGWKKLLIALGENHAAPGLDRRISIGDVVVSNGRVDALWCLRCLSPREAVGAVLPAVKRAAAHTTDQRVHDCIAALDRWLASDDAVDLAAARAARVAAEAARAAAAAWAAWAAAAAEASAEEEAAEEAAWAWAAEGRLQVADLLERFPPLALAAGGAA